MDNAKITKLSLLEPAYAEQASSLLVDRFYAMFKSISKDREILRRLFAPCMQLDLFYVMLDGDRIMGMIAVSDRQTRAVVIDSSACQSIFGKAKGKILAWQLNKIMGIPAVNGCDSGYIDFLATAPEYKRRGVAGSLMTFVEENAGFADLYLDVLESNDGAIRLYQKLGYKTEQVKKGLLQRMSGIKAMYIMKKTLKKA